jgi:aminomuconate-semialdehyde/2-hydroxymuconate-6-semialdehyde dehydrogenase
MQQLLNYIGGEFQAAQSGQWLDVYEPATGQVYAQLPDSDEADIEVAVRAAMAAKDAWGKLPADDRAGWLFRLADAIDERAEELAQAESKDNGKPVALARKMDIPRASANFRFFAHAITQYASEAHTTGSLALNYTLRHPLGVVGCIAPWNLPLYLFTWKIAPALAAGNCVVAKPTEITPLTAFLLSELVHDVGLPAGVLNLVHGRGPQAGVALVEHPGIKAISFTGGTSTGQDIARRAAPQFKKLSLELGGKNPNLIFDDCDYERALATAVRSAFTNQGQICLCGSRILVQASLYERFRTDFVERVRQLRVGDPLDESSDQGAVVSEAHFRKVLDCIELAKTEGGQILCGGHPVNLEGRCAGGWFIAPTVIEDLPLLCRTNQEEIFGPVVTLMPFEDEAEALALANGVPYGLAAMVWTQNLTRAHRVAATLQAGIVWVNCWLIRDLRTPFGGMKQSGVGREGGFHALDFFTEAQNVCIYVGD